MTERVKPIKHDYVYFRLKRPFDSKSTYLDDFQKPNRQLPPVRPFRPDRNVLETVREFDDRTVYRDEYVNYRYAPMNFNKYSKEAYNNKKISSTANSSSSSNSSSSKDLARKSHQKYDNNQQVIKPINYNLSKNDNKNIKSNKSFDSSSFVLEQFEQRNQNNLKRTKLPSDSQRRLPFEAVSLYKTDYSDFSNHKNLINSSSYW
jgi:hypothetical protein